jgi:hypothetical protein
LWGYQFDWVTVDGNLMTASQASLFLSIPGLAAQCPSGGCNQLQQSGNNWQTLVQPNSTISFPSLYNDQGDTIFQGGSFTGPAGPPFWLDLPSQGLGSALNPFSFAFAFTPGQRFNQWQPKGGGGRYPPNQGPSAPENPTFPTNKPAPDPEPIWLKFRRFMLDPDHYLLFRDIDPVFLLPVLIGPCDLTPDPQGCRGGMA